MDMTPTVSVLTEYIKKLIEGDEALQYVTVKGEISNFIYHRSGHMYFTLKDEESQIKAVMFKGANSRLAFKPENGQKVVVSGSVSVYGPSGSYQLYVTGMKKDGIGDLYLAFEELKQRLAVEGLFDAARKKPLPAFPQKIGVITSANGAAVRDIINVASRRSPSIQLVLYPALVQGAGTEASLIQALDYFENEYPVDAIIIGRGGGSIEDLWGFNGEQLARKIYAMATPVISAVGHETDFTICDFVADKRAPTPSAAAELAVPDTNALKQRLDGYAERAVNALAGGIEYGFEKLRECFELFTIQSVERLLRLKTERLKGMVGKVESLSPLAVLARGYAVVTKDGKAVKNAATLALGDRIELRLSDGEVSAKVIEK